MLPTVAVIAPGMMGSAVAARLTQHGISVRSLLAGRSDASLARARKAGMTDGSLADIAACDIILSIVPPGEAVGLAEKLAPALRDSNKKPVYADCNAISPRTVVKIDRIIRETGATFVDGGIIGPPPEPDSSKTRLYLSGPEAERVAVLGKHGLNTPIQSGPVGAASAMKMSYAGITKGFQAMGAAMILAATKAGTADALIAEMQVSQVPLLKFLSGQLPRMHAKAYRWVAEMEEIADFIGADRPGSGFYTTAADLYRTVAADFDGPRDEVAALNAFCEKAMKG
jgi:3-hydroxyisobutyrate dehydrogenase-like beta-hydroxyacid dehydrogenase